MHIVIENEEKRLHKSGTKVGEVYSRDGALTGYWLRCQGGFVSLASGSFNCYADVGDQPLFVHCPNAKVVIG